MGRSNSHALQSGWKRKFIITDGSETIIYKLKPEITISLVFRDIIRLYLEK